MGQSSGKTANGKTESSGNGVEAIRARWADEQKVLAQFVETGNRLDFDWPQEASSKRKLRYIGGVDISFVKMEGKSGGAAGDDEAEEQEASAEGPQDACAALVVMSYPDMKIVYEEYTMTKLTLP